MRFDIQRFDVVVEKMNASSVYLGVIEGPWAWAAKGALKHLKNHLASVSGEKMAYPDGKLIHPEPSKWDVYNEPDWDNLPKTESCPGYFHEKKILDKYMSPKGYWVAVWLRSYTPATSYECSEYRCIVFLEDLDTNLLRAELQKIQWDAVCWDGDIS